MKSEHRIGVPSPLHKCLKTGEHYHWAKGSDVGCVDELSRFTNVAFGNTSDHHLAIRLAQMYMMELCRGMEYKIMPVTKDMLRDWKIKERSASAGEPWVSIGGTMGDVLDTMGSWDYSEISGKAVFEKTGDVFVGEDCYDYLLWSYGLYKKLILMGEGPEVSFYVHVKEDKYSMKKIINETYRTIQGGCLFLHMLQYEYGECIKAMCYEDNDKWIIKADTPTKGKIMRERFGRCHTVGVDYTAYDRYQSPQVVQSMLDVFSGLGMNTTVAGYIADMISNAPLSMHGGSYITRSGGNPSGQYWTTLTNCYSHTVYIAYFWIKMEKLDSVFLLSEKGNNPLLSVFSRFVDLKFCVHGDDEIS